MAITIAQAKKIREELGLSHLVIFGITPDGYYHVATHGETRRNAEEAAKAGNNLKTALGFPQEKCQSKPVERKCSNCEFFNQHHGCTGWLTTGDCCLQNVKLEKRVDEFCKKFIPK